MIYFQEAVAQPMKRRNMSSSGIYSRNPKITTRCSHHFHLGLYLRVAGKK
ncbi:hypothetical protein CUMW_282930 [Citrus unshiu]|uniref:Uncharacterized protein n=1 Tax=Citrus unshiu TaxID=55188 RepID=A0A2H5N4E2_CITUN|nr:hypothetical protein CUMW_282930 [Citrus unshiu]